VTLRAALTPGGSRGLAVLLTGRTAFLEKAAIVATPLLERGYSVVSLDWRGQGLSDRLVSPAAKGHVAAFAEYHADLATVLADPAVAALGPPRLVVAHSMGGAIALGALADGVLAPVPLVLSAPMLGIAMPWIARAAARLTIGIARLAGRLERWPPFGDVAGAYPLTADPADNLLTGDREVFAWLALALRTDPRLQTGMPTIAWFSAAEREMRRIAEQGQLPMPSLCLLGGAEAVVDPKAVRAGASRLGVDLVDIPGARHEVLIEAAPLRAQAWAAIDRFLADAAVSSV
jgi:lysophospholipase